MRRMTLSQICQILKVDELSSPDTPTGYCTDTRLLKEGELFIALKGERVDGHHCLEEAKNKKCCAAIVSLNYEGPSHGLPLIFVPEPLQALQQLARELVASRPVRIVAITGSLGKTTTKEFLKHFLGKKFRVAASPGNSNSQVGIPLTILNHTDGYEDILILEMGMTHPGNILGLIGIAPPELAIITTVALVHACNFESINDIARTKAEILSHPKTKKALLQREMASFDEIITKGTCEKASFSLSDPSADYFLQSTEQSLIITEQEKSISIGLLTIPGKHNLNNLLAAIAAARYFGVSWEEIKVAIPELQLPERRLQYVKHKGIVFINDAYNAAELSVKSALECLPTPENKGVKVAVLGSMMELGKFSNDCHLSVGEHALKYVDKVFCLGQECLPIIDLWKREARPVELFSDIQSLIERLKVALKPDDVVLLKGSRSKELWKVIEKI